MFANNKAPAFDEAASIMSVQKMALKISCDNITKRVRDLPETFDALKDTVKAQMSKGKGATAKFIQSNQFSITYEDDTGDVINLSDDEDLLAAYDVAETSLNRQLKLNINARECTDQPSSLIDSNPQPKIKSQEEEKRPENLKKSFKQEDE